MNIIDSNAPAPVVQLAAQTIINNVNAEMDHLVNLHRDSFNSIWRNPSDGATPDAILAALGIHAGLIFALAGENLDHIARCAQAIGKQRSDFIDDADCTPPAAYTIHPDGTITLN
jgi:hypothetical protein